MLEDQSIQQLISWSESGDLFSVTNPNAFSKLVLPQYFKHNNWQSFVRQLNMYGFHKVNDMIHSNLTSECQKWEFRHQNFRRGAVEELQNIKRKSAKSHHQYLSATMPTSSVSASSMGRLLLGQQQQSHYQHQLAQQPGGGASRSNQLDDGIMNDTSKMDGQPNPIYQHVMRLEDRVSQIAQSHETLKNETDELKFLLTKQQTAMQGITDLMYTLTKNDSKISNVETLNNIRHYVNNVYDSMNSDTQYADDMDYEYSSLNKGPEEKWDTMATYQSRSAPPPPNSSTPSYPNNPGVDNFGSRKSSLLPYDNDTHRNSKSTTTTSSSDSSNSNSDSSGKKDSIPISSILSPSCPSTRKQDDLKPTSATTEKVNLKRLPSLDAVCKSPYPSDQHHQHHHHHHHNHHPRQSYPSTSSTTSLPITAPPNVDYERPMQSLPPIQPIRSYLGASDSSYQGAVTPNSPSSSKELAPTEPNQVGTRVTSPYLGLGKESALLNPGTDRPPPCDHDGRPEPKRKCTEH